MDSARSPTVVFRTASAFLLGVVAIVLPVEVFAQAAENNLTSGMLNNYRNVMIGVANQIGVITAFTFWSLATIEMVYSLGMKALGGGDPGDILQSFVKRLLFIGFWGWMLTNAKPHLDLLIDTMVDLASRGVMPATFTSSVSVPVVANNSNNVLNPDNIIDQGIDLVVFTTEVMPTGITEIGTAMAMLIAALGVFVALLVIAAFMALTLVEMYIVGYGAIFLLALGPNRHTTGYAQAYLRYVFSLAIKIFAIALIAAIAEVVMTAQIVAMSATNSGQVWATLGMAFILAVLAAKAPSAIQGAIAGISQSGAPISAGGLIKGATIAGAQAAGGGAAIGAAGAAAASTGMAAGSAARAGGASAGMSAARGVAGGLLGAGGAVGSALAEEVKEAIGGRSPSNPYPRGGTAGGRMAVRIAEKAKRNS